MNPDKLKELETVFYPRSVAVVGASPDRQTMGYVYMNNLLTAGFTGKIYAVNPNRTEVLGIRCYPSVRAIPGELEYVIVCIPREFVLDLMDDCAAKGVKVVQLFTGGFGEASPEGRKLEEDMVRRAKQGGFRILGPNCIGVYCPSAGMSFGTTRLTTEAGAVACISQSGGLAIRMVKIAQEQGVRFSKVISYGNACDLDALDFLEYLSLDPETAVVGAYVDGLKEGNSFLPLARSISRRKPLVIWKGGRSEVGAETASSHTGALASSSTAWTVVLRQAGAIMAGNLEELIDALLIFQHVPGPIGNRAGLVTGFGGGGGGPAVSAADAFVSQGLLVPAFAADTRTRLRPFDSRVGSIVRNPLDFNSTTGTVDDVLQALSLVATDSNVDFLVFDGYMFVFGTLTSDIASTVTDVLIEVKKRHGKPVFMLLPLGSPRLAELGLLDKLRLAHIPVYPTAERAARAIRHKLSYSP